MSPSITLQQALDDFLIKLRLKLSAVPRVENEHGTPQFSGLYSAALRQSTTRKACRIAITPYQAGHNQPLISIDIAILAQHAAHAADFLAAAQNCLEQEFGFVKRHTPAATQALQRAAEATLGQALDHFSTALADKLTLLAPARENEHSTPQFSGLYSAALRQSTTRKACRIIVTPYQAGHSQPFTSIDIAIPAQQAAHAADFLATAQNCLEQKFGFLKRHTSAATQALQRAAETTLDQALDQFSTALAGKLAFLAPAREDDAPPTSIGLYSFMGDDQERLRIHIVPYCEGEKGKGQSIDMHIPVALKSHRDRFIETARHVLEHHSLIDRSTPTAKDSLWQAAAAGTEQRVNAFVEHLRGQFDHLLSTAENTVQEASSFNGLYSAVLDTQYRRLRIVITPCINGVWQNFQALDPIIPDIDTPYAERYLTAIRECLENNYALVPRHRPLMQNDVKRLVSGILKEAEMRYPEDFSANVEEGETTRGIFTTNISLPSRASDHCCGIQINLRPLSDYIARDQRYILQPASFKLNTNTGDIESARNLERYVHDALKHHGYAEYNLQISSHKEAETKEIPKHWITRETLRTIKGSVDIHQIIVVESRKRIPPITWSSGTRNLELAHKKRDIIRDHFLPLYEKGGERENEPLTLKAISDYMQLHCPERDIPQRLPPRNEPRTVTVGTSAKVRLNTPNIIEDRGSYRSNIGFASPDSTLDKVRNLHRTLNTTDREIAEARARRLQALAAYALERYFKQHPHVSIATEISSRGKKPGNIFKIAAPGEQAEADTVFFSTLADEVICPAFEEFGRYIYWDTAIAKAEGGTYTITCAVRRNEQGEALPEHISLLQGPLVFSAASEAEAQDFCRALQDAMVREQYLFSRDRPVEHFGQNSMAVAIRESLRDALQHVPAIGCPENHQFAALKTRILH